MFVELPYVFNGKSYKTRVEAINAAMAHLHSNPAYTSATVYKVDAVLKKPQPPIEVHDVTAVKGDYLT